MFISSQESSHRMKMLQFNTNGILLKTFHKNPGYTIFNIRIYEHLRLDDDPKIQCKNYMKPKEYAEVVWYGAFVMFCSIFIFSALTRILKIKL